MTDIPARKTVMICSPCHALQGGVESIISDLCRNLPERGWEPLLALGKGAHFNNVDRYRERYPDLPIIEVDGTKGTRQARKESLIRRIRQFRPDVVMNARIFDVYPAMVELKRLGWPGRFITTIRVFETEYLYDAGEFRDIIDMCIVSGTLIAEATARFSKIPRERIISLPGGVRPPLVTPAPRLRPDVIRIGYVARITNDANKRVFDLVETLALLDAMRVDFQVIIAGAGPNEAGLRAALSHLAERGKVEFLGWVSRERLYEEIYPRLDCLVHFAQVEGVTIAPREAMVHGVVPVISRFYGLKSEGQFLDDVNSLTFPVGDIRTAAHLISRLATEPGLITRLSENAIASQSGKYGFAGNMDAWAAAFDRSLELPQRTGPGPSINLSSSGRLARLGMSPWLAQRFRDVTGRKPRHRDPGGEWPHCSGNIPAVTAEKMVRFVHEFEEGSEEAPKGSAVAGPGQ